MTKLEFALKHFKRGAKIIRIEDKIIDFSIAEMLFDMDDFDKHILVDLWWSRTPKQKGLCCFETADIKGEKTGFNFYLVTEEY